jgi:two-component system, sensor histidine kinase and response regulator
VELASDGQEALDHLRDGEGIELVLMDMRMPVMDGLEATQRLRAGESGVEASKLPVVAVTANASEADREACRAAGMNHYLSKPINRRELEKVLLEVISPT